MKLTICRKTDYLFALLLIIFITMLFQISCQTVNKTKDVKKLKLGLNYTIPEGMYDSTGDARRFRYDNLLIDRNKHYLDSSIIIAVRQTGNLNNLSLKSFTETDQANLMRHYDIEYLKEWIPESLTEKKIEFISIQFTYKYANDRIYQRSIYIRYNNIFYIVSMSSKNSDNIISNKSNSFWDSIYLVY